MSLRNRCGAFAGSQTFAVTFAEDFDTFAGDKWDVLWLPQSNEDRRTPLVSYSFPLGEWRNQYSLIDNYLNPHSFVLWGSSSVSTTIYSILPLIFLPRATTSKYRSLIFRDAFQYLTLNPHSKIPNTPLIIKQLCVQTLIHLSRKDAAFFNHY